MPFFLGDILAEKLMLTSNFLRLITSLMKYAFVCLHQLTFHHERMPILQGTWLNLKGRLPFEGKQKSYRHPLLTYLQLITKEK
ncbi:MAG: hypothetical protein C4538_04560 [Nitrospiraceae bacterium]|nr:MAG: hypothetical protein C4538_04560 [Nitrospiraceae bacterium]